MKRTKVVVEIQQWVLTNEEISALPGTSALPAQADHDGTSEKCQIPTSARAMLNQRSGSS
jgi:hypothetical protein